MTPQELTDLLNRLIAGWENEIVEFKEGSDGMPTSDIGKYFSALANEANLKQEAAGWLVFGVKNSTRSVVGTDYREDRERLEGLKKQVSDGAGMSFRSIHELSHPDGRVLLFEIPPAPPGLPVAWNGHYFAREGESLSALSDAKRDEIRNQTINADWTAAIVTEATVGHLDPHAIDRARRGFAERHPRLADEVAEWSDETFLDKARITLDGRITRAALLLLGKETSAHLLSPHMAEMSWKLTGPEDAFEHFGLPFLLTATELSKRIRNIQIRLVPPDELIMREISKYDDRSLLEAIYNCIAHQDYSRMARIIVIERVDRIEFISIGGFYDRAPEDYMLSEQVPRAYRNPFLVAAMTELNLIDHMGNGIHRMVQDQVRRFLPLPDYDLSVAGEVKLTIPGAVIDEAYSKLLMMRTDLPLEDVLALDRVQKGLPISGQAVTRLKKAKLIEGRKPHYRVSPQIAAASGTMADYVRNRPQSDEHYIKLVLDLIDGAGSASRKDIDLLLLPLLSDALSADQKQVKISNLLSKMKRQKRIVNRGSRSRPSWVRAE